MNGRTDERMNAREKPMRPMRPVLQGWLDRHEPAPTGDLLFQVMREVETVEQKGSTRAWLSWFADSPAAGWMMATAAVAALAIAVVVFVNNPFGTTTPMGAGATPTPTATAEPTQDAYPSPLGLSTEELVDQLFADWTAADLEGLLQIYTPNADVRWANSNGAWGTQIIGSTQLEESLPADFWEPYGTALERTGPIVQQGGWVAVPMTLTGSAFDGVAVLQVVNGFVAHHYTFGMDEWPVTEGREAPALYAHLIEDHLAAVNAHDGEANAAFFAPNGQLRMYVGSWTVPAEYLSPDAIAGWTVKAGEVDFHLTRTNSVIEQGTFLVYAWTMQQSYAPYPDAEGVAIVQIDADDHIVNEWVIGD